MSKRNEQNNQIKISSSIKARAQLFEAKKPEDKTSKKIEEKRTKVLPGCEIVSKDNPDMILYKYPKLDFFDAKLNSKILLFIGNHSEKFIDTFINIYAGIHYEDKFRYIRNVVYSNDVYEIYLIKGLINLYIICFPKKIELVEFMQNIFSIFFYKKLIPQELNCIFITTEKKEELSPNQKIITLFLFFILEKSNNDNRIKVLFSSNDSGDNLNAKNNNITNDLVFSEYFNISQAMFDEKYKPEYIYINNNSIYDKNLENSKRNYNDSEKNIKNIFKTNPPKCLFFDNQKVSIFTEIANNNGINKTSEYRNIFNKYNKNEQILMINYLLSMNSTFEISTLILYLFNKIVSNKKEIKIDDIELSLNNKNELSVFGKVKFCNLNFVNFKYNYSNNNDSYMIKNLFTENLIKLNLSRNALTHIKIFDNEENLINLNELDLSYNNIKDIESLINCKFSNLKTLNLKMNDIEDISCLEKSNYFNKLEILDLSNNKIKSLNIIEIKSLKFLNLIDNEISEGIVAFLDNIYFDIDKLIINKDEFNNNILFGYYYTEKSKISAVLQFKYHFKGNRMNEILKNILFKGIKYLQIIGFDNYDFLNNESLTQLKELNIDDKINDLTLFKDIKFKNIERIVFNNPEPIKNGFNLLCNIFKSMVINNIKIEEINNKYNCLLKSKYPEFYGNFIFKDLNFLKGKFLENVEKIDISQKILDNENNFDFFSLNEIKNSFPIFKKLKCEDLDINYNKKYIILAKFYSYDFKLHFVFDDLNFIFDDIFNEIKNLKLSNITFREKIGITKEKFPLLKNLELDKNNIESMEFFYEIDNVKDYLSINSNSNICDNILLNNFDDNKFKFGQINTIENKLEISYYSPINFYLYLDKFDKKLNCENCKKIHLNNINLTDNDINIMNLDKNYCLEDLQLDGNKIRNLEFLNNINSSNLKNISLKNNLLNSGLNIINNNGLLTLKSLKIKLKEDGQNFHEISFEYFGRYNLSFDYLSNINESLDCLKGINFTEQIEYLDLSGIKLKKIDFLVNETMKHISLNIDNNMIEDISIFDKINFNKFVGLSIKQNHITKGINALNSKFFNTIYVELEINKIEYDYNYRIRANFIELNTDIEFYINDINELNNLFDFKNTFVNILNGYPNELKIVSNELIQKMAIEPKIIFEQIKLLLNKLKSKVKMLSLIKRKDGNDIINNDDILVNDNNKELLEKLFIYLRNKLEKVYFISEAIFIGLKSDNEKLIMYFPLPYIYNVEIIGCELNLNCLKYLWIENLDLSKANINDIQGICELTTLKSLNLRNNPNISNLFLLKDAKFKELEELDLSNNNIKDLNEIKMNEYKFNNLTNLNLSNNEISNFYPLLNFKSLLFLDIEYNKILFNYDLIASLKSNLPHCEINFTNQNILESGIYIK